MMLPISAADIPAGTEHLICIGAGIISMEFTSNYIASQILGLSDASICYPAVPNLVFTLPRIAQVGVTVDEAEKCPDKYRIVSIPYGAQNEWVDNRELDIDVTFIIDSDGFLAGAVIYGSEAGTWIDFLTLIINKKITCQELRNMIFAHHGHEHNGDCGHDHCAEHNCAGN